MVFRCSITLVCTLLGAIWLWYTGPIAVIRISTPTPAIAPFWYLVLVFPVLGMLIADLIEVYRSSKLTNPTIILAFHIALLAFISNTRIHARIPISGHSLIISYFITKRLLSHKFKTGIAIFEFCLVMVLL